ncbi:MAG: hypothetical protein QM764_20665 [Chitinophagaceae bacterium]
MSKLFSSLLFCFILSELSSCCSTKNLTGKYGTNFATLGFFGTTVKLKLDSSLEFIFQGDLIYHRLTGHYQVYGHKLYMTFDKEELDSNDARGPLISDTLYKTSFKGIKIVYQKLFYVGHHKLFFGYTKSGKKITKTKRYNKRKKYLFFGSHMYSRRYYLRRIN